MVRMVLLVGVLGVCALFVVAGPTLLFLGIGVLLVGTGELEIVVGLCGAFWLILLANTVLDTPVDTTPVVGQFAENALTPAERASPALQQTVDRLAHQASIPAPAVLITPDGPPTAYTSGIARDQTTIVVTTALIEELSDEQLRAVLAHEISHIVNRDVVVMTIVAIPHRWAFRLGGGVEKRYSIRSENYGLLRLFAGIVLVFERMVSRTREFVADRGAVALIGSPAPLVGAIRTLDGVSGRDPRSDGIEAFSFFPNASSRLRDEDVALDANGARTMSRLFLRVIQLRSRLYRTHPDPEERIKRLQALDPDYGG